MAVILSIETSTDVCSAALTAEGMVLCHREDFSGQNHAALLSGFIKACLDRARELEMQLDAVAVSMGPGSYTGLRIGLSEAKGLAFALDIPLIGVDTLKLLAVTAMFEHDVEPDTLFAPMIDARRMEVFTGVFDMALEPVVPEGPVILDADSFADIIASGRPFVMMGNGSDKACDVIHGSNVRHLKDIVPLAQNMIALAERDYASRTFIDLAYSVPNYLKEFQATVPKRMF
ncbi:MAG: tRNA (adenosine(37)-N6)-threonylcarbamoyltransferase complex dimerization subunit type 1 TsaB [Muribaculaceae bacterium]|nr:tRNA (adenosine(37)-N6)-threonylcarbamoyltransferase complex dimerization subunit type 1 TsaB [Muribaculaceae bacterium]